MKLDFHVPGPVVGKGRPRIGRVGAHARMFTPEKTVRYENLVAYAAHEAMRDACYTIMESSLQVNILVAVAIPHSWSKKKRSEALVGALLPTSKPDLDNYAKAACDAMNGIVYKDDSQVATLVVKKRYRETPGLWVSVFDLSLYPAEDFEATMAEMV